MTLSRLRRDRETDDQLIKDLRAKVTELERTVSRLRGERNRLRDENSRRLSSQSRSAYPDQDDSRHGQDSLGTRPYGIGSGFRGTGYQDPSRDPYAELQARRGDPYRQHERRREGLDLDNPDDPFLAGYRSRGGPPTSPGLP